MGSEQLSYCDPLQTLAPVHYIWCSWHDPGEKCLTGRRIERKRMGVYLVPYTAMGNSHLVCCIVMLIIIMFWGSRDVHHLAGWRSWAPVTLTVSGSKHTDLQGDRVPLCWQIFINTSGCCCSALGWQVCWTVGGLHTGEASPGVRHACKLLCYT